MKYLFFLALTLPLLLSKVHASQGVCKIEYAIEPSSYQNSTNQDPLNLRKLLNLLNDGNVGKDAATYIAKKFIGDNDYDPDGLLPPLPGA